MQCKKTGCHIHFAVLYTGPQLEIWEADLGPFDVRDHLRFHRRRVEGLDEICEDIGNLTLAMSMQTRQQNP